jgi:hypothetical protein
MMLRTGTSKEARASGDGSEGGPEDTKAALSLEKSRSVGLAGGHIFCSIKRLVCEGKGKGRLQRNEKFPLGFYTFQGLARQSARPA